LGAGELQHHETQPRPPCWAREFLAVVRCIPGSMKNTRLPAAFIAKMA
jgi:hypothetical protein